MAQSSNVVPLRGRKGSAPNTLNGKVTPLRRKNSEARPTDNPWSLSVPRVFVALVRGAVWWLDRAHIRKYSGYSVSVGAGRPFRGANQDFPIPTPYWNA